jgi:cell division protein FtsW
MTMASPISARPITAPVLRWPVDPMVAVTFVSLLLTGLVMVASASVEISAQTHGSPLFMFLKHGVYMGIALAAGAVVLMIPVNVWHRLDWLLLLLGFALLIAVLVPGVGKEVNGSTRWISFGAFSLQGSEFTKLFVLIYIAGYLVRHKEAIAAQFASFIRPLVLVVALVALLLQQPDFGAAVVIMAAVMGVIFLAGVPMRHFIPIVTLALLATIVIAVWQPYRLERLTVFTNPWEHQYAGGYQLTQALIAFGRGEWFGLGLGNSIQKLFFLPEAHTDFLFSIIAEELGVFGALVVIALFACLVTRGMWIGRMAENRGMAFHAYLAFGISLVIGIQAAVNIGVNIGVLPTKGLTLPLMSYGGNSLIVSCVLVALLLRIEYECRKFGEAAIPGKRRARRET